MATGDLGLREGRAHVIMQGMKRIRVTGCAIFALISLSACYQQQQQQPGAIPTPEAVATESPVTDSEQDATASQPEGADVDSNEVSTTATENETEQKHVCSGLLSCKLGLCPNGKKRNKELAEQSSETTEETNEGDAAITPTAEQMEAARALLAAENKKKSTPHDKTPVQHATVETETAAPVIVTNNTSGIPGRGGLRMGHFAPKEEATSTTDANAPLPNAAERHGLRSPSLPKSLPMNIDGKTNTH